jgi:hypothetical protein
VTADGGYAVAGVMSNEDNTADAWIVKLTSAGSLSWQKSFKTRGSTIFEYAETIHQSPDGSFIVAGEAYDDHLWLLKLSAQGSLIWAKAYGGDADLYTRDLIQASDGGYIIVATGYSSNYIVKVNSAGDIEWQRKYLSGSNHLWKIQSTSDGGYVVVGFAASLGAGDHDIWVIKLNPDGSIGGNCPPEIAGQSNLTTTTPFLDTTTTTAQAKFSLDLPGSSNATSTDSALVSQEQCLWQP